MNRMPGPDKGSVGALSRRGLLSEIKLSRALRLSSSGIFPPDHFGAPLLKQVDGASARFAHSPCGLSLQRRFTASELQAEALPEAIVVVSCSSHSAANSLTLPISTLGKKKGRASFSSLSLDADVA